MTVDLIEAQTFDHARGSFFVNELPVKNHGKQKTHRGRPVFRGSHHVDKQNRVSPHPYAIDFTVSR